MKESAQAALSFVRSRSRQLGLAEDFFQKHDIHIHVPEGAIPKRRSFGGVIIASALYSAVSGKGCAGHCHDGGDYFAGPGVAGRGA